MQVGNGGHDCLLVWDSRVLIRDFSGAVDNNRCWHMFDFVPRSDFATKLAHHVYSHNIGDVLDFFFDPIHDGLSSEAG